MTAIQRHRGPDGDGQALEVDGAMRFVDSSESGSNPTGHIALGHRRLSIIDLDIRSAQPMTCAQSRYWITYNGEIYNYRELREELLAEGIEFRTESDTEVALEAYAQWGRSCFERFNGIWAMAIWDSWRQTLLISRDRLGVKPLHYAIEDDTLFVASEIKAIVAARECAPSADAAAIDTFLRAGIVNHGEGTFFHGVFSLPAGHLAELEVGKSLEPLPVSYWTLPYPSLEGAGSFDANVARLSELLNSAITLQMRSDVAVGTCLSGGVDSSAITCIASRLVAEKLSTFTVGNEEQALDERDWATRVARHVGAIEHVAVPDLQGFLLDMDRLLWHQEEPFGSTSIYAQWCLMRLAKESSVTVMLDGQGADELFCGYKKYFPIQLQRLISERRAKEGWRVAVDFLKNGDRGFLRWREAARYLPAHLVPGHSAQCDFLSPFDSALYHDQLPSLRGGDLQSTRRIDLLNNSVPPLLRYEDRNSMAWSVESRVPFLDHRLVEFAMELPPAHMLREGRTKAVLRAALRGSVPDPVLERRDKYNFFAPMSSWLEGALGASLLEEIRASPLLRSLGDTEKSLSVWQRAGGTRRRHLHTILFRLGILAAWARVHEVGDVRG